MTWLALSGSVAVTALLALLVLDLRSRLELVARAEHELRGPLAALALAAEHVRRGGSGPEVAGLIEAQLDRSRAGLGDLSRARRRRRAPDGDRSRVALEGFVRHATAGWRSVAASAGRDVRLDWRAGGVEIHADRGRLAQALGNLLSNAIEHGQGEIAVSGRRVGERVRIEIANGAGPDASARAGRMPGRGPRPTAPLAARDLSPANHARRPALGRDRGRGLHIAGSAVEAVGGELTVDAGRGGTTAVVELPVRDG